MVYFSLIISLVTCSIAVMTEYEPNEPKRFQMLLFWLKKPIVDYRLKIEKEYEAKIKWSNEYFAAAIRGLEALSDNGKPIYTDEIKEKKLKHWLDNQETKKNALELEKERKLSYEWYLKPIILCVYCMPSFWGSILWASYFGFAMPLEWLTTITMSVFINAVLWKLYDN